VSYGFSALMLLLFSEIMEWKWSGFELGKLYKIHARHKAERQMDDYRACPSDRERERGRSGRISTLRYQASAIHHWGNSSRSSQNGP